MDLEVFDALFNYLYLHQTKFPKDLIIKSIKFNMKTTIFSILLFLISAGFSQDISKQEILPEKNKAFDGKKTLLILNEKDVSSFKFDPMQRELNRLKEIEKILSARIGKFRDEKNIILIPKKLPSLEKEIKRQKEIEKTLRNRYKQKNR